MFAHTWPSLHSLLASCPDALEAILPHVGRVDNMNYFQRLSEEPEAEIFEMVYNRLDPDDVGGQDFTAKFDCQTHYRAG